MKYVHETNQMIDRMTCKGWKEDYHVSTFYEIPLSREEGFLGSLQEAHSLDPKDILKIKNMLFGRGAQKVVRGMELEWGRFDGRYALFATICTDTNFSLLFADYTLEFKEKPRNADAVNYYNVHGGQREKLDHFFKYKALKAFRNEGVIDSIKEV